ncbi:hypothetical protein ANN_23022 [Periplaneta americana]|uniref:Uncharacterized protein n=1 Tax=Periplaneta americana TaxID=6978 RepID=A0ABQ8SLX0_PERAM|nr:hypothetical protein ANN_23022 [Periplaneta americana]
MLAGSEFQSLGRAIVKEDEYEEVRWDGRTWGSGPLGLSDYSSAKRDIALSEAEIGWPTCQHRLGYLSDLENHRIYRMDAPIPALAACEVRSVIKFLNAQGITPIEIYRQLCQVYGPNVMSKQMVRCSTRSSVMMVGLPLRSSLCTFWLKIVYSSNEPSDQSGCRDYIV